MSSRRIAKTGKFADARHEVELARMRVDECRSDLLSSSGDFDSKVSDLNLSRIELFRKEEYLKELLRKARNYRDKVRV